jgi:hypothetical protein
MRKKLFLSTLNTFKNFFNLMKSRKHKKYTISDFISICVCYRLQKTPH